MRHQRCFHRSCFLLAVLLSLLVTGSAETLLADAQDCAPPSGWRGPISTVFSDGSYVAVVRSPGGDLQGRFLDTAGRVQGESVLLVAAVETEGERIVPREAAILAESGPEGGFLLVTSEGPAPYVRRLSDAREVPGRERSQIFGRRFDRQGRALAPRFLISSPDTGQDRQPQVVALPAGGALVVWERNPAGGGEASLVSRRLDGELRPVGAEEVRELAGAGLRGVALAVAENTVLMVWERAEAGRTAVVAQLLDDRGHDLGPGLSLSSAGGGVARFPAVGSDGASYLVAWRELDEAAQIPRLMARRVSGLGAALGSPFDLGDGRRPAAAPPVVAAAPSGEYRVAWRDLADPLRGAVSVVRLPAAGSAPIGPVQVGPSRDVIAGLSIAPGEGGEFLLAWGERTGGEVMVSTALLPKASDSQEELRSLSAPIYPTTGEKGTCYSSSCQQCRAAGWSQAHDQCVYWAILARSSYKVRYRYTGADEGHDHAGSLLMYKGDGVDDVCNVSKGTCCQSDSGCFLGLGGCSGSSSARVCKSYQSCVGQFGAGGPMSGAHGGGWLKLGWSGRLFGAYGGDPYDCDCTSGVAGSGGYFEIWVNSDGSLGAVPLAGPRHPNSGAGTISTQGSQYEVQTYKALTCGTFYDGIGCTNVYRQINPVNLDYRFYSSGNPNYYISESCN